MNRKAKRGGILRRVIGALDPRRQSKRALWVRDVDGKQHWIETSTDRKAKAQAQRVADAKRRREGPQPDYAAQDEIACQAITGDELAWTMLARQFRPLFYSIAAQVAGECTTFNVQELSPESNRWLERKVTPWELHGDHLATPEDVVQFLEGRCRELIERAWEPERGNVARFLDKHKRTLRNDLARELGNHPRFTYDSKTHHIRYEEEPEIRIDARDELETLAHLANRDPTLADCLSELERDVLALSFEGREDADIVAILRHQGHKVSKDKVRRLRREARRKMWAAHSAKLTAQMREE